MKRKKSLVEVQVNYVCCFSPVSSHRHLHSKELIIFAEDDLLFANGFCRLPLLSCVASKILPNTRGYSIIILIIVIPPANCPLYHHFCHQGELESVFSPKVLFQDDSPIIGTNTQSKVTADELLDSREEEWREFAGTQGEEEYAQSCLRRRSGAGIRAGFSDVLGPC